MIFRFYEGVEELDTFGFGSGGFIDEVDMVDWAEAHEYALELLGLPSDAPVRIAYSETSHIVISKTDLAQPYVRIELASD